MIVECVSDARGTSTRDYIYAKDEETRVRLPQAAYTRFKEAVIVSAVPLQL